MDEYLISPIFTAPAGSGSEGYAYINLFDRRNREDGMGAFSIPVAKLEGEGYSISEAQLKDAVEKMLKWIEDGAKEHGSVILNAG